MFYCDQCAKKNKWPIELWGRSSGPCELCHTVTSCNDVPSKYLAGPERTYEVPDAMPKLLTDLGSDKST